MRRDFDKQLVLDIMSRFSRFVSDNLYNNKIVMRYVLNLKRGYIVVKEKRIALDVSASWSIKDPSDLSVIH